MRAILFDFGGTLDYPRHWLDRFLTHYRSAGIELSRDQLDLGFDHATRVAYRSSGSLTGYGLTELVDYLVRLQIGFLGRHGSDDVRQNIAVVAGGRRLDEAAGWITQCFLAESREGFAASREVLAALSGRFKLGVVSNFYGNLDNILAEAGLARFFGTVGDSSRVGIFKPDLRLFTHVLGELGALPGETAMVGDSLDKDCAPARKLGLTAIWLRHRGATATGDEAGGSEADFTIDELAGLEHLQWCQD